MVLTPFECVVICHGRMVILYFVSLTTSLLYFPIILLQRLSKRTGMIRALVSEVVGMSPYERRMLDMLKTGGASADKRMYKYAKRRLGSHKRALKKREQVKDAYAAIRAKAA
jgi:large subunit ribosomal protein L36e